jgi:hypothetical protein
MVATRKQKEVMVIAQAIIYEFGQRYPEAIGRLFAVLVLPPNRQTKNQLYQCLGGVCIMAQSLVIEIASSLLFLLGWN